MAITLKTDKQGLAIVDDARKRKNWSALATAWCDAAKVSVSTLKRFRERKFIQKDAFISICQAVDIQDWEKVAAAPSSAATTAQTQSTEKLTQELSVEEMSANVINLNARWEVVRQPTARADIETDIAQSARQLNELNGLNITAKPDIKIDPDVETIDANAFEPILRQQVPALSQIANFNYRQLVLKQDGLAQNHSSQRSRTQRKHTPNSNRSSPIQVKTQASTLKNILADRLAPHIVNSFYDHLANVQQVSESLFSKLTAISSPDIHERVLGSSPHSSSPSSSQRLSGLLTSDCLMVEPSGAGKNWLDVMDCCKTEGEQEEDEKGQDLSARNLVQQMSEILNLLDEKTALVVEGETLFNETLSTCQNIAQETDLETGSETGSEMGLETDCKANLKTDSKTELRTDSKTGLKTEPNRSRAAAHSASSTDSQSSDSSFIHSVDGRAAAAPLTEIKVTDIWGEVVRKAIALRCRGRMTEAIAAFRQYGDMFADEDPTARPYAQVAQQFTQQLPVLGLTGGLYVYERIAGGAAIAAGIPLGSIIIAYGSHSIQSEEDLAIAQKITPVGEPLRVTYLVLSSEGQFTRQVRRVLGGPLGAGLMQI